MAKITVTTSGPVIVGDDDEVIIDIPGGGEVTIIADPTANVDKIRIRFKGDTESDTANVLLSSFSENNLMIEIIEYDGTDEINLLGAYNQYVDPDQVDEYTFDYTGSDTQTYSGYVKAKDGGEKDFTAPDAPIIICFGKGTEIETLEGPKPVEQLQIGEMVLTQDHTISPIRWIGSTHFNERELAQWPELRPVRVRKGALGVGRPNRDILLSPQHRVLIAGWRAELHFGEAEVLVPIKALVGKQDIEIDQDCREISYYHVLLESHKILFANDLPCESLFLGDQSIIAFSKGALVELQSVLSAEEWRELSHASTCKPSIKAKLASAIVA